MDLYPITSWVKATIINITPYNQVLCASPDGFCDHRIETKNSSVCQGHGQPLRTVDVQVIVLLGNTLVQRGISWPCRWSWSFLFCSPRVTVTHMVQCIVHVQFNALYMYIVQFNALCVTQHVVTLILYNMRMTACQCVHNYYHVTGLVILISCILGTMRYT